MNAIGYGTLVGIALGFAALLFGFWGFVLVLLLGTVGALVGASVSGRIDLRAAVDAARGRRVG